MSAERTPSSSKQNKPLPVPGGKKLTLVPPEPRSVRPPVSEPAPASGRRTRREKVDPDKEKIEIELDTRDPGAGAFISTEIAEPHERLELEAMDDPLSQDESEETSVQKTAKFIQKDAEVLRWRKMLEAVPANDIEHAPIRNAYLAKVQKAELLAERRDAEAQERAATTEAEQAQEDAKQVDERMRRLNVRLQEEQVVLERLKKELHQREQARMEMAIKQERTVQEKKSAQRTRAQEAFQVIDTAEQKTTQKILAMEAMLETKLSDTDRADLESDIKKLKSEREKIGKERKAIREHVAANIVVRDANRNSAPEPSEYSVESIAEAARAVNHQERALEDLDHDLAEAKGEAYRLKLVQQHAFKQEEAAKLRGIEVALALGGMAAVLMEDDVAKEEPVEEVDEEADRPTRVMEKFVPVPLSVRQPPQKESRFKNTKRGAKKAAKTGAILAGRAAIVTVGFGAMLTKAALKLFPNSEKFAEELGKNPFKAVYHMFWKGYDNDKKQE